MPLRKPTVVTFDVTYNCNLDCKMCQTKHYYDDGSFGKQLSKDDIITAAKRLHGEVGGVEVFRFIGAEPLLHPDIIEIVREVSKVAATWITTNGTLLTDEMSEKLIGAGLSILVVSLDGPKSNSTEFRGEAAFEECLKGLRTFDKINKSVGKKVSVEVSNTITSANYNKLFAVDKLLKGLDVSFGAEMIHVMRPYAEGDNWNGQKIDYLGTGDVDEGKALNIWQTYIFRLQYHLILSKQKPLLLRPLYVPVAQLKYILRKLKNILSYSTCYRPAEHFNVRADGKIYACEFLRPAAIGDIHDAELWNTKARLEMVETSEKGTMAICKKCNKIGKYRL